MDPSIYVFLSGLGIMVIVLSLDICNRVKCPFTYCVYV